MTPSGAHVYTDNNIHVYLYELMHIYEFVVMFTTRDGTLLEEREAGLELPDTKYLV